MSAVQVRRIGLNTTLSIATDNVPDNVPDMGGGGAYYVGHRPRPPLSTTDTEVEPTDRQRT